MAVGQRSLVRSATADVSALADAAGARGAVLFHTGVRPCQSVPTISANSRSISESSGLYPSLSALPGGSLESRMQPIAGSIEDIVEGLPGRLPSPGASHAGHGPTVQPADTLCPRLLLSVFVPIDMPVGSTSLLASLMRNPGDFSLRLWCRHPYRDHSIPRLIVHLHTPRIPGWPKSRRRCRARHCSKPVYPMSNPRRRRYSERWRLDSRSALP